MSAPPATIVPVKLNNGVAIHQLGFGTWQAKKGEVKAAVVAAVRSGFRHIDAATIYRNEDEVGEAIAEVLREGVVRREELFITTKLWNTHHAEQDVKPALLASLKRLQLEYVDLYLTHWPVAFENRQTSFEDVSDAAVFPKDSTGLMTCVPIPFATTWKAMEEIYEAKLARAIGVSNMQVSELEELLRTAKVVPAVNQVELHPALPQTELRAFHQSKGIVTQAYCPLGIGKVSLEHSVLQHPRIVEIAKAEGIAAGELLLRWNLQAGNVVLSKSVTPSRIAENAATSSAPLSNDAWKALEEFGKLYPLRISNPDNFPVAAPYFKEGYAKSYAKL